MADKKITALTAASEAASEDLIHIIDDPNGSPVNKKLTVKSFLGGITHTSNGASAGTDEVVLKIAHVGDSDNSSTNVYNNVITLQVNTSATHTGTTDGNVGRLYTAEFTNHINDANTIITTEGAAIVARLSHSASNPTSVANVYCMSLQVANTATQSVNASAFLKLDASGAGSNTVNFVMDIIPGGGFGASAGANAGPIYTSGTAATSAGALKVQVSGTTRYIALFSALS
jgi:hypothetical protein